MDCSIIVFPVRGGATINPRWPLPTGQSMSSTRPVRFSLVVSRWMRALRIERRQVVEENFVARDFGVFEIDGFHFNQREVALAILGRAHLAGDGVAGAQIELADLRWRDVDIVRAGQIVIFRRAQEAEAVGQAFEHAFGEDQPVLFGLGAQDLENQFLFAHAAGAGDLQILGDFRQVGDVFFLQFCKTNAHCFCSFYYGSTPVCSGQDSDLPGPGEGKLFGSRDASDCTQTKLNRDARRALPPN